MGEVELWVAGCSDAKARKLVPKEIKPRVHFFTWQESLNDFYASIDVLLHPALSEPYGMVVVEALAHRVPVVVSDQTGARDSVTKGCGYVLSLEQNPATWAGAVRNALKAGFRGSVRPFTWHNMALLYQHHYDQCLAHRHQGRQIV